MTITKKTSTLAAMAASALLVAACGGSGGGGGGGGSPTTSISGKAADGYLRGATVCLDMNGNKRCDAGEPATTTAAGGVFTLDGVTAADIAKYAIIVEVVKGQTVDEDTGTAVDDDYILSAPPGNPGFVSPLTTAVHGVLERNPALTADEAAGVIKQKVGAGNDISLFDDYIAKKKTDNSGEYQRLHHIAQVSAKVLAETQAAVNAAASNSGIDSVNDHQHLLTLVIDHLLDQLDTSAKQVDEAGENFDVNTVPVAKVDTSDLQNQIERSKAQSNSTVVNVAALLEQGVYWLWADSYQGKYEYEYGLFKTDSKGRLTEAISDYDQGAWQTYPQDDDARTVLTANGVWKTLKDDQARYLVTPSADGSATISLPEDADKIKVAGVQLDVSGKRIKDFLQHRFNKAFAASIPDDALFSSGAMIYRLDLINMVDSYEIWHKAYDADFPSDPTCAAWGYNCNVTFGPNGVAASFDELIYPGRQSATGNHFGIGDGLIGRVIQDGTIQITDSEILDENNQPTVTYDGSWKYETVAGKKLMILTIPKRFFSRLGDETQPFLVEHDDFVRQGNFWSKGAPSFNVDAWFNEAAKDNILSRFNPAQ